VQTLKDTVYVQGDAWLDVARSQTLWNDVFAGHRSVIREGQWVDRASVSMPSLYLFMGAELADALRSTGRTSEANAVFATTKQVARVPVKTDKEGKALVRFQLPASIARGDGLLTVLVEDAGVTESIQKRIPIVMNALQLAVFPEGGDLVEGVPSRVYFMAKTLIGKPADIEGRVVDDRGRQVATFSSIHDGMGRFELEPATGARYHLEITRPANIVTRVDVPAARPDGCVLRSVDPRAIDVLRVAAICKTGRQLQIEATLRETDLAARNRGWARLDERALLALNEGHPVSRIISHEHS